MMDYAAWTEIAKHVCERELTDALAAARRELAEAAPEKAGAIRMKLNDLAAKAKKWNVEAKVPNEPVVVVQAPQAPQMAAPETPAGLTTMLAPAL